MRLLGKKKVLEKGTRSQRTSPRTGAQQLGGDGGESGDDRRDTSILKRKKLPGRKSGEARSANIKRGEPKGPGKKGRFEGVERSKKVTGLSSTLPQKRRGRGVRGGKKRVLGGSRTLAKQ